MSCPSPPPPLQRAAGSALAAARAALALGGSTVANGTYEEPCTRKSNRKELIEPASARCALAWHNVWM